MVKLNYIKLQTKHSRNTHTLAVSLKFMKILKSDSAKSLMGVRFYYIPFSTKAKTFDEYVDARRNIIGKRNGLEIKIMCFTQTLI